MWPGNNVGLMNHVFIIIRFLQFGNGANILTYVLKIHNN